MVVNLTKQALDLGILTRDHDAMLAFYHDVLGLPVLRAAPSAIGDVSYLGSGSSWLKLVQPPSVPPVGPAAELSAATGLRYFTLRVSNLDEVLAECEEAGARTVWPKESLGVGVSWVGMVADPDGNIVAFVEDA